MLNRRQFFRQAGASAGASIAVTACPSVVSAEKLVDTDLHIEDEGMVAIERQIRRYVRRSGGFRRDLHKEEIAHAKALLAIVKREKIEWDTSIAVSGFELIEMRDPNARNN
jgi:fructose-specific phosphotransferase system component IIB